MYSFIQPEAAMELFHGGDVGNKKKRLKIKQKLMGIINQMQRFTESNSLGIYGQARLQKEFSDRLLELGYDAAVTRQLVEIILFRSA